MGSFTPSVGFEGGFRLKKLKDFEDLIRLLEGFKNLYVPMEQFKRPAGAATTGETDSSDLV